MRKLFNFGNNKDHEADNLGFSSKVGLVEQRLLNKDGRFNLERRGERAHIYHQLITMGWLPFFGFVLLFFTLMNGFFALIYLMVGIEHIAGAVHHSFFQDLVNMFHFSVQTMTTVGYGHMYPNSVTQSIIASIESLMGLLSFALATGLVYGRFSNPQADIKYSKHMLFVNHPVMGKTLQVRMANRLSHDLMQADARIVMLHNKEKNNKLVKQYQELKLEMSHIYFMPMNWTLVHKIDEDSPLYNKSLEQLKTINAEFLVLVSAFDDTFSQMVYSRTSYIVSELVENATWEMAYSVNSKGERVFDIDLIDNYVKLDS